MEDDAESGQIVIRRSAPNSPSAIAERIGDEKYREARAAVGKSGAKTLPVAQVLSEIAGRLARVRTMNSESCFRQALRIRLRRLRSGPVTTNKIAAAVRTSGAMTGERVPIFLFMTRWTASFDPLGKQRLNHLTNIFFGCTTAVVRLNPINLAWNPLPKFENAPGDTHTK